MKEILSEYLDIFCVAYLDYILIFSQNLEDHRKHVRTILKRVKETGLTLKASKCEFHTKEIEYLGYVISPQGLRMDEEKIRMIKEWKEPTNIKGIQSFLGFPNFYRRFIQDYSRITTPLTRLTRKEVDWESGDEQQMAFETLKTAMVTEPILQHFDLQRPITIKMDASDYGVVRVRRRVMGVRWMRTGQLACCRAWSCSFMCCCSVMMAPRAWAIDWSCCWSALWNSFMRWASVQCTTWLRRASLVVVWWSMVTMSCSKDICSLRRAAGVAARAASPAATSSGGAMFSWSS